MDSIVDQSRIDVLATMSMATYAQKDAAFVGETSLVPEATACKTHGSFRAESYESLKSRQILRSTHSRTYQNISDKP